MRVNQALKGVALFVLMVLPLHVLSVTSTFLQTGWSGGKTSNTATHTTDQIDWTQYSATSTNMVVVTGGTDLRLGSTTGSVTQTNNGTTITGFNLTGAATSSTEVITVSGSNADVRLAAGTTWGTYDIVDGTSGGANDISLALDSNDKAHIVNWYNFSTQDPLAYQTNATSSSPWSSYKLDPGGFYMSVATDSNNKAHISYEAGAKLKYATNATSSSFSKFMVSSGTVQFTDIALDSNDKVHISYYAVSGTDLHYATNASGSWVTSTVDTLAANTGQYTSIKVDSNNKVHIAYRDTTNNRLKYATNATSSSPWSIYTIGPALGASYVSLDLDSNNKAHIAYVTGANSSLNLRYATNATSTAWSVYMVDGTTTRPQYSSLALDSADKVHISYYDSTGVLDALNLLYATNESGSWALSTLDSVDNVGAYSSIAVDSNDRVHVAYGDVANSVIRYLSETAAYPSDGTFVSGPMSFGASARAWDTISWVSSGTGTIKIKARTDSDGDFSNADNWDDCPEYTSGAALNIDPAPDCIENTEKYIQYRAVLHTDDTSVTPVLESVTIKYITYATGQTLTSSAFNTESPSSALDSLSWTEDSTLPSGTGVTVAVRTADSAANLAVSGYVSFTNATANCSKVGAVVTCPAAAMHATHKDATDDQWFQYRVTLTSSDGVNTPTVGQVQVGYIRDLSIPPTVDTPNHVTSPTQTTVTLNGNITGTGGTDVTVRGFAYGTTANLSTVIATTTDTAGAPFDTGFFTADITGLTCDTIYYVRAYATNTAGTGLGDIEVFSTNDCPTVPIVSTQAASSVSDTDATLNGTIAGTGTLDVTVRGFAYGTTANLSSVIATTTDTSGAPFSTGAFTADASDLSCNTTYYARAYATNSLGSGYGSIQSFTTDGCPPTDAPTVTTGAASSVTDTTATLNGTITDAGDSDITVRGFAYGTSATLTTTIATTTDSAGAPFSVGAFTADITGLTCDTIYYVRAYATNTAGTGVGSIQSFTPECIETEFLTVTTEAASSIADTQAVLNGTIATLGVTDVTIRGFAYGIISSLSSVIATTTSISGAPFSLGAFSSLVSSGLSCGDTYYFRAYATDSSGDAFGSIQNFDTDACPDAPTVFTQPATSVEATEAVLNGEISETGGADATVRGFAYGTDSLLTTGTATTTDTVGQPFSTGGFETSLSSLTCGTTYYFRAYATNTTGTGVGTVLNLTTSDCPSTDAPTVTTGVASSVTDTMATLNGSITDTGDLNVTVRGFAYGTTANLSSVIATTTDTSGAPFNTGAFTDDASDLACDTTHYVRAYATNSAGTGFGTIRSFTPACDDGGNGGSGPGGGGGGTPPGDGGGGGSGGGGGTPPGGDGGGDPGTDNPGGGGPDDGGESGGGGGIFPPIAEVVERGKEIVRESAVLVVETTKQVARLAVPLGALTGTISFVGAALPAASGASFAFSLARLWHLLLSALGFRKRKPWGVVYDSVTKHPIDPEFIRLTDAFGTPVQTTYTDLDGRYGFLVAPGTYHLEVEKKNYIFPSVRLQGRLSDGIYDHLYTGGSVVVSADPTLFLNIPLDPADLDWQEFAAQSNKHFHFNTDRDRLISFFTRWIFRLGFVAALYALVTAPSVTDASIVGLYAVIGVLRLLGFGPRAYGYLTDAETGKPLAFALVTIKDALTKQEVTRTIADHKGRYYVLVPEGEYTVEVGAPGQQGSSESLFASPVVTAKKGVLNQSWRI